MWKCRVMQHWRQEKDGVQVEILITSDSDLFRFVPLSCRCFGGCLACVFFFKWSWNGSIHVPTIQKEKKILTKPLSYRTRSITKCICGRNEWREREKKNARIVQQNAHASKTKKNVSSPEAFFILSHFVDPVQNQKSAHHIFEANQFTSPGNKDRGNMILLSFVFGCCYELSFFCLPRSPTTADLTSG